MMKLGAAVLILCAARVCAAQEAPQTRMPVLKHFRLTFVLSDPQSKEAAQTIQLDVPVGRDRPGMTGFNSAAGSIGEADGSIQESIECTDVSQSSIGLTAKVSFSRDILKKPIAGASEPVHSQIVFMKQIDIALQQPTKITEEMHMMPLSNSDGPKPKDLPQPMNITVTATQL